MFIGLGVDVWVCVSMCVHFQSLFVSELSDSLHGQEVVNPVSFSYFASEEQQSVHFFVDIFSFVPLS